MSIDPAQGIAGLKGALRYVRHYRDQTFVVKLGGDVVSDLEALHAPRSTSAVSVAPAARRRYWLASGSPRFTVAPP